MEVLAVVMKIMHGGPSLGIGFVEFSALALDNCAPT